MTNSPFSESTKRFLRFLDSQLSQRGWTDYRLCKEARLSPSVISRTRSGTLPKWEACEKIAHALDLPTEVVFRAADLLPMEGEHNEELAWLNHIYSQLTDEDKQDIHALIKAKIRRKQKKEAALRSNED